MLNADSWRSERAIVKTSTQPLNFWIDFFSLLHTSLRLTEQTLYLQTKLVRGTLKFYTATNRNTDHAIEDPRIFGTTRFLQRATTLCCEKN